MTARSFKMTLAYDGTAYAGWQVQLNGPTIQAKLEDAIDSVTGQRIRATASGRTDAGVHAHGQIVGAFIQTNLDCNTLLRALNANLPFDIRILNIEEGPPEFDPIRDAVRKRYRYVIDDAPIPNVFQRNYVWQVYRRLDEAAMQDAANVLLGKHDFSSFEAAGSERATSVRTIFHLDVNRALDGMLHIEVEADGFLYNMVRNIVGSLMEIGRGRESKAWLTEVLAAKDRKRAGQKAPAQGLFLLRVDY